MIRAVRGATTCENDERGILGATGEMLSLMMKKNGLCAADIISIIFTCTDDLTMAYPARAAREMGILSAGLMCVAEMTVEGSLKGCVRAMMLAETLLGQADVKHVYLKGAKGLRPDLIGGQDFNLT